ncbi:hypothetical protein AB0I27_22380 [Streptomyces sp. NPDC050597]|uniref:hypothetical protein n=1 Tax=Streptomyces sp. NPDC050597 TaxID=3157212 RepID=UPI003446F200
MEASRSAPTALRIRVLSEVLDRVSGRHGSDDGPTEQVGAATVRAVLAEMLADMQEPAASDTLHQNPDGSWSPTEPLPLTGDFDVEVYGSGPYRWTAWAGRNQVATGAARTRLGLRFATASAKRRHARSVRCLNGQP